VSAPERPHDAFFFHYLFSLLVLPFVFCLFAFLFMRLKRYIICPGATAAFFRYWAFLLLRFIDTCRPGGGAA
jgi:hypothetical protein